ncbi:glycoside hydrolase family 71 protein [Ramaria rubella]|nr:glycoside hydrolase family 71 protein [Ramaria rubella]
MIGNTYASPLFSYTPADWTDDIGLAFTHGIDGFALNVGSNPWQPKQVAAAFAAAKDTPFKLFLSFDMTSLPGSSSSDATILREYINTYYNNPNQLRWNDEPVVSTFGGEHCTFGQDSVNAGWYTAIKEGIPPVHFIPSFFDISVLDALVVDGTFNWNSSWPMGNHDIEFEGDRLHIAASKYKTYMAAVSPWFFTHYGPDSWNKNWIYRADNWLYNRRWEMLVQNRDQIHIVQILSWNDYGESHYVGPIRKDQPNSHAWVNGFDHHGWLKMTEYYARGFKTGSYPIIEKDQLYLWARPHAAAAHVTASAVPKPNNTAWTQDFLWAVVFAIAPAHVTLISGTISQRFEVPAGVTKLKLACSFGAQSAILARNHKTVLQLQPEGFHFTTHPEFYNFNAFVASASS